MRSPHNSQPDPVAFDESDALTEAERLRVDRLLDALTQPRLEIELAGQDEVVRAIAARVRPRRRRRAGVPRVSLGFLIPRRPVAGLALAACVFAATTGAAFAGVLPSAAQHVAHRAFDRLGVDVPGGAQHSGQAGGPARANGGMSGLAHDPSSSGHDKGASVSKAASHGKSKAGDQHGRSDQHGRPDTTGNGDPPAAGGADNGQGDTRSQTGSGNGQGTTHAGSTGDGHSQGGTHSQRGTEPTPPAPGGGGQGDSHGSGDKTTHSAQ